MESGEAEQLRFSKWSGLGNDFVVFDCTSLSPASPWHPSQLDVVALCKRGSGVGADGVIAVELAEGEREGDCSVGDEEEEACLVFKYWNSDGTVGEMCGNGIRCFAKFAWERGLVAGGATRFAVHTLAGVKRVSVRLSEREERVVESVAVGMGAPIFQRSGIPFRPSSLSHLTPVLNVPYTLEESRVVLLINSVNTGVPHTIVWMEDNESALESRTLASLDVMRLGRQICEDTKVFPAKTNVGFAQMEGSGTICVRFWERGAGETLACGTGACAAAAIGVKLGKVALGQRTRVRLPGGDMFITCEADSTGNGIQQMLMEGPATLVYDGVTNARLWRKDKV